MADRGSVYTRNAFTLAFFAMEQQYDAPLFDVVQVAPNNACNAPIASVLHFKMVLSIKTTFCQLHRKFTNCKGTFSSHYNIFQPNI